LYVGAQPTLTVDQAAQGGMTLLDARAPERFRGDVEPLDPVAGHIPGAKNLPSTAVLAADGTFLGDFALGQLLSDRGIDPDGPVGAYCGSGVTASVVIAALAAMGRGAALFPGSWSQWSSDPSRAAGRGPE
jgi:thiosulfate/3-mercaptopyruvate sulfurtransferase